MFSFNIAICADLLSFDLPVAASAADGLYERAFREYYELAVEHARSGEGFPTTAYARAVAMSVCDGGAVPAIPDSESAVLSAAVPARDFASVMEVGEDGEPSAQVLLCVMHMPAAWPDWNFSNTRVFRSGDMVDD